MRLTAWTLSGGTPGERARPTIPHMIRAASWEVAHQQRSQSIGDGQRQAAPRRNGRLELRAGVIDPRQLPGLAHPVVPVELLGLRTPLPLEAVSAAVHGAAAEIEAAVAALAGKFQNAPVKQHVHAD